jgi:hypothetical protein
MYVSMRREYVLLWMFSTAIFEAVEASSFGCCHFSGKITAQVLTDDAIGGSKECKNMGDKVAFIGR